jgi:RNA recognition motif-containing protein
MPSAWQSCKLFVGGLSAQTTTESLRGHFTKYGRLVDAVVMSKQGRPRGFGFVTFETPAGATAALKEQQWLGDRFVDVKRAVPGEQPAERAPNKIFVGGLPQDATTEDLRACFADYGSIADAVVMVDRRTKRSRGFGFIRFASGAQGTRAAEAVLLDAANHRLGGKWVEVKRATPAALLQDLSPCSGAASSPPCTPKHGQLHQQTQQEQNHEQGLQRQAPLEGCPGLWGGVEEALGGYGQALGVAAHPHERRRRNTRSSGVEECSGVEVEGCGLYSPLLGQGLWGHLAYAGAVDGLGMGGLGSWDGANFSPFSPLSRFSHELPLFDSPVLGTTPTACDGARAFHSEVQHELSQDAADVDGSASDCCPSIGQSDGDDQAEENKPAAANRAVTPPPGRLTKRPVPPPGLGIEASPMKVEFRSKCFEEIAAEEHFGGFTLQHGLVKIQPLLSAC